MTGENKQETDAIRKNSGVQERSFLQETPNRHLVIWTFEGDDPVAGWGSIMANLPPDVATATMELHCMERPDRWCSLTSASSSIECSRWTGRTHAQKTYSATLLGSIE